MSTEEIASELFNNLAKCWIVSFDEKTISVVHSNQSTVIERIEIDLENSVASAEILRETVSMRCSVQNATQAIEVIKDLLTIAVARHSRVCRRLEKAIADIGD